MFGIDEAAVKMDILTASTTTTKFLTKMKNEWDSGFPSYSSAPTAAIRAALTTFWTRKPRPQDEQHTNTRSCTGPLRN